MRDQIVTGINEAVEAAHTDQWRGTVLRHLTPADVALLADHILDALAQVPEGTPAPTVAPVPAGQAIFISPAEVVAMLAATATTDLDGSGASDEVTDAMWPHPTDNKEVREFIFAVQAMFGCRVRSTVVNGLGGQFLVAGQQPQITALAEVYHRFLRLATPITTDMTPAQRREFWATLGALVTDPTHSDRVEHLIEANRGHYAEATAYLTEVYGPARTLPRGTAAESGEVFEQAVAVVREGGAA